MFGFNVVKFNKYSGQIRILKLIYFGHGTIMEGDTSTSLEIFDTFCFSDYGGHLRMMKLKMNVLV